MDNKVIEAIETIISKIREIESTLDDLKKIVIYTSIKGPDPTELPLPPSDWLTTNR